ncbi:hypothetical protein VE01_04649 [Pseudogymnoascus verrucosus]|uniref:RNA helicase n=1 Tax=Pseudogymnoascus verrucosus TaxID=342668 RepID=A0A1B8GMZ7_9PEZI|nr:uncharacterized protein VE01_04649 [Pseudogymnoascus verrucosus]OBT97212.1 hypothetical protein VE01_04649 [Pseudogymnoascus verrucosus]
MAGGKKKKKPASNPARGFATTSVASKVRIEVAETTPSDESPDNESEQRKDETATESLSTSTTTGNTDTQLTPEEFEKQLEESDLQVLVEKYSQKAKRDAARQVTRLQTDRRLLRGQADFLNTRKWLPPDLMDEILDIVTADHRALGPSTADSPATLKPLTEEDLTIKLWTLQQALAGAGFPDDRVRMVLTYILSISDKMVSGNKDSIWGLEESLQWMARECSRDELPDYENWQTKSLLPLKLQMDSQAGTPTASGMNTPRQIEADIRHVDSKETIAEQPVTKLAARPAKPAVVEYESDIDADDLLPEYLEAKTKLFHLQPPKNSAQAVAQRGAGAVNGKRNKGSQAPQDPEMAKLQRKLVKIESDVLFDRYEAEQEWQKRKITLEKEAAAKRQELSGGPPPRIPHPAESSDDDSDDEIMRAAAKMGADLLEDDSSDDDGAIADLFANLPVTEVDPVTGKSTVVINDTNGGKITLRDFGKSTGISPRRVLEEACRSRDSSVKIVYTLVSKTSYSNRHSVRVNWSKAQEVPSPTSDFPEIDCICSPKSITITMTSISTPDAAQSESYAATVALFLIFSTSVREEKVFLRLPPVWRELWTEFAVARKEKADALDREAIRGFRDTIRQKRDREEEDGVVLTTSFRRRALLTPNDTSDESGTETPGSSSVSPETLKRIWHDKSNTPSYQTMRQSRMQLPMWGYKEEVLRTIDREQVVIICGETGCGKSTQVPAFILEHQLSQGKPCKLYCTEPRRISAISLAKRVSEELGERKGDVGTPRSLIGYAIRLETNTSRETRVVYATTGIVMRMLESSNDLKEITHIVLDEVHERTIDSDFLLIILRKLMARRPDLKVVLMSATVDAERFSKYLDGAPVLQVPGRTFPVTSYYLEDAVELTGYSLDNGSQNKRYTDLDDDAELEDAPTSEKTKAENTKLLRGYSAKTRNTILQMDEYRIDFELVAQLIAKIATDERYVPFSKAILVFLPGIGEIRQLNDILLGLPTFRTDWYVYPLHSSIASEDQEAAFLVPPPGTRKIVLATNIAETGITIPDVTCVIDAGKHREMRFDERRQLSRLLETFISRANAKQRRGRAGRVQEGLCFHLFTKYRHDELMSDQQTPELLRLSLQDLAIRVKTCKLGGIEETLGQALDPPSAKNIRRAVDALIDVRALTAAEELTPLGIQLSRLPLDVFLGKLILLGSIFKCLDATITVAAILSSKSPFQAPFGARQQADTVRLAFRRGDSDLLTNYNAYLAWKRVCNTTGSEYQFCRKNFLSPQTLSNIEDLKGQLTVSLVDSGFLPLTERERAHIKRNRYSSRRHDFFELPQRANINSENDLITQSVIAWALYPKLLVRDGKGFRNVANNQSISLHPTSVNKGHHEINWLSYYHIMQAKQFYNAHETTAVTDFAIALLCGDVRCDFYAGVLILDGNRARFAVSDWKTMVVLRTLRTRLREIMTRSFKNPGKPMPEGLARWLEIWQRIFSQENLLLAKGLVRT